MSKNEDYQFLDPQICSAINRFYEQGGVFVLSTEDKNFIKQIGKILSASGLDYYNYFFMQDFSIYLQSLDYFLRYKKQLFLFSEDMLHHKHCYMNYRNIKYNYGENCLIICLTSNSTREVSSLYFEMGADDIIVKPFSLKGLAEKIFKVSNLTKTNKHIKHCKTLLCKGKLDQAKSQIKELMDHGKSQSRCYLMLGNIAQEKQETEKAKDYYLKAHKLSPDFLDPLHRLAEISEDNSEKIHYLSKLDQISPRNPERKLEMGKCYSEIGEKDSSEQYFESSLEIMKDMNMESKLNTLMDIAQHYKDKDLNKCMHYMNQILKLRKDSMSASDLAIFNEIGLQLRKQGRWQEAVEYYGTALDLGEDASIYYNIGIAYLQGKYYFKTIEYMLKAVRTDESLMYNSASIPYNLGLAYAKSGNTEQARDYFEKALEINPEFEKAKDALERL